PRSLARRHAPRPDPPISLCPPHGPSGLTTYPFPNSPPVSDLTTERLLVGAVRASDMVTAMAFLRAVGARDCSSADASFGGSPGDLLGEVGQIGGIERGVHAPRLEAHAGDIQMLMGDLGVGVIAIQLVDGAIDLLAHRAGQLPILG